MVDVVGKVTQVEGVSVYNMLILPSGISLTEAEWC